MEQKPSPTKSNIQPPQQRIALFSHLDLKDVMVLLFVLFRTTWSISVVNFDNCSKPLLIFNVPFTLKLCYNLTDKDIQQSSPPTKIKHKTIPEH